MDDVSHDDATADRRGTPSNAIAQQARRWGIRMVAVASLSAALPFVGFEVRGLGRTGTWIFAAIIGSLGAVSLAVSFNQGVTSLATFATKSLLYLVVLVLVGILLSIPIAIVYFLVFG
jgi:hypothetical protein